MTLRGLANDQVLSLVFAQQVFNATSTAPSDGGRRAYWRAARPRRPTAAPGAELPATRGVGRGGDDRTLLAAEEPPVFRRAERGQVLSQPGDELRRNRNAPNVLSRPIPEPAVVVGLPRVRPPFADGRTSLVDQRRSPVRFLDVDHFPIPLRTRAARVVSPIRLGLSVMCCSVRQPCLSSAAVRSPRARTCRSRVLNMRVWR